LDIDLCAVSDASLPPFAPRFKHKQIPFRIFPVALPGEIPASILGPALRRCGDDETAIGRNHRLMTGWREVDD